MKENSNLTTIKENNEQLEELKNEQLEELKKYNKNALQWCNKKRNYCKEKKNWMTVATLLIENRWKLKGTGQINEETSTKLNKQIQDIFKKICKTCE